MSNSRSKAPELLVVTFVSPSTVWPVRTSVMVRVRVAFGSKPRPATSTWSQTGQLISNSSAPKAGTAHRSRSTASASERANRIRDLPQRRASRRTLATTRGTRQIAAATPAPAQTPGGRLGGQTRTAEARMILLVNLLIFAGIVLIPLGLAVLFMKLRRRFSYFS